MSAKKQACLSFDGYISDALPRCPPAIFIVTLSSPRVNQSAPMSAALAADLSWRDRGAGVQEPRGSLLEPAGRGSPLFPLAQLAPPPTRPSREQHFAALFNLDGLGELQGSGIFTDPRGQNLCTAS